LYERGSWTPGKNTLMTWEDDLAATEHALGRAHIECDAECNWAEAIWQDYQARMRASTAYCRRSLDFDQVLRGGGAVHSYRAVDGP
jgi:hypothetical protein